MEKGNKFKQKIKILHIPTSGVNAGGITKFIIDTMTEMQIDNEVSCYILSPYKVSPFFKKLLKQSNKSLIVIEGRSKNPVGYFFKILNYIKKNNFDIVQVHGSSSLMAVEILAAKAAGVQVRIAHSHNTTCSHKFLNNMLKPVFLKNKTHALACSQEAGKWLFGSKNFEVIHNGIDLKKFEFSNLNRSAIRSKLGIEKDTFVIGHVGHFNYQKNHEFLVDVFKKIEQKRPNSALILIGTGKLENKIRAQVEQLHLNEKVFFIGNIDDVYKWLSAMDVFFYLVGLKDFRLF